MDANGSSTDSSVGASPFSKTRRKKTLLTVSTPDAFCLLRPASTSFSESSRSCTDLPPKVTRRSASASSLPCPQSTSPDFQSCGGRSAWVGMASAPARGPGNLSRTVRSICSFVGLARDGRLRTSESYLVRAS